MPPKPGWKKGPDGHFHPPQDVIRDSVTGEVVKVATTQRSHQGTPLEEALKGQPSVGVAWNRSFVPFGDRLDFLSPENQHLNTGRLRILPAKHPRDP